MRRSLNSISITKGEYGGGFSAIDYFETAPRYIRITDINENGDLNGDIKAPSGNNSEWEQYFLEDGDLLFARSGATVGKTFLFERKYGKCIYAGYLIRFQLNKDIALPKFVYYYTKTSEYLSWVKNKQNVVAQPNINAKQYGLELQIPLPPLDTQKKIAAILDAADEYRQKTKALIEKYDQLAQSLFLEMFGDPVRNEKGWEIGKIRDLVSEVKYGTSAKSNDEGKYPYLRMNNITYEGFMDYSDLKYIDISEEERNMYLVKKGDLLFNRTNSKELVGKTGIIDIDKEMVIAGYLIRIRTNELANPYYLWAYLNSKWAKKTLLNMCKSIVGMANINAQELQEIKTLKPPIVLQNRFEERYKAICEQKQQAQASLQKAEELFNSLLQRAFKGELV